MKRPAAKSKSKKVAKIGPSVASTFDEVVRLIEQSRERAFRAVNSELVNLY